MADGTADYSKLNLRQRSERTLLRWYWSISGWNWPKQFPVQPAPARYNSIYGEVCNEIQSELGRRFLKSHRYGENA